MLRIDIDNYKQHNVLILQSLFFSLPLPWKIRVSASGKGLHVQCDTLGKDDFRRTMYDDIMRISLDGKRTLLGLPDDNLLWCTKMGKNAQEWTIMKTQKDILSFFEYYLTEKLI